LSVFSILLERHGGETGGLTVSGENAPAAAETTLRFSVNGAAFLVGMPYTELACSGWIFRPTSSSHPPTTGGNLLRTALAIDA
jgi:hypothetical protein